MRIGEVAKRTGLNVSSIRFYERKGLLQPERGEDTTYREYTEEDVLRIKKILLCRKMDISIETIYLLLNGQADPEETLRRQQETLREEMEKLSGSLKLCNKVLQENLSEAFTAEQIEKYMTYVELEEERGGCFAEITELLEDITDFTGEAVLQGNAYGQAFFYRSARNGKLSALVIWGLLILLPVSHLVKVWLHQTELSIPLLAMFGIVLLAYAYDFVRYRSRQRQAGSIDTGEDGKYV